MFWCPDVRGTPAVARVAGCHAMMVQFPHGSMGPLGLSVATHGRHCSQLSAPSVLPALASLRRYQQLGKLPFLPRGTRDGSCERRFLFTYTCRWPKGPLLNIGSPIPDTALPPSISLKLNQGCVCYVL